MMMIMVAVTVEMMVVVNDYDNGGGYDNRDGDGYDSNVVTVMVVVVVTVMTVTVVTMMVMTMMVVIMVAMTMITMMVGPEHNSYKTGNSYE